MLFLCEFWTLCTVGLKYEIRIKWQIVDRFFFMIEFKVFFYNFQIYLKSWVESGTFAWILNSEISKQDPD